MLRSQRAITSFCYQTLKRWRNFKSWKKVSQDTTGHRRLNRLANFQICKKITRNYRRIGYSALDWPGTVPNTIRSCRLSTRIRKLWLCYYRLRRATEKLHRFVNYANLYPIDKQIPIGGLNGRLKWLVIDSRWPNSESIDVFEQTDSKIGPSETFHSLMKNTVFKLVSNNIKQNYLSIIS